MGSLALEDTDFRGLAVVRPTMHADDRGRFFRVFCVDDLADSGHPFPLTQASLSTSHSRHTLRGLHYQLPPHEEAKLVRCVSGAIYDVVVDLRPDEPTYGRWFGIDLSAENALGLLIPRGFAHGFCTLTDATSVLYMMDSAFVPEAARGIRWNDPAFGIRWPCAEPILNTRDATWPDRAL